MKTKCIVANALDYYVKELRQLRNKPRLSEFSSVKPGKLQGKSGSLSGFTAGIDSASMSFSHMFDDT
jgi:hypothetical protein